MGKTVTVDFFYRNELCEKLEPWMIMPPAIQFNENNVKPDQVTNIPTGEKLGYYILNKDQSLHLNYEIELYSTKNEKKTMTDEERNFYLRNTILSPINTETTKLAKEITSQQKSDHEKARAIFHYIVENYRYIYPPSSRGVHSFLEAKEGDCGEFSFLFTALCRALKIPARTVVGSWAYGKMNAHVWNEFFIEDEGWISVDTSMAYIQKKQPFRFFDSSLKTLHWKKYFGETEGQRVVFSKDTEIELLPKYKNDEEAFTLNPILINGDPFCWGQQSLNGRAPYLQPIYVKYEQNDDSFPLVDTSHLFGTWKIREHGIKRFFKRPKEFLLMIALLTMAFNFVFQSFYLEVTYKLTFIIFFLCFIFRRERIIIFSVFLLVMTLSLLSTLN
ncbi:transglutaminase-like domain-containing protein [Lysinibacillus sp. NPDC096212]|uniref:transglutaminase-like domain-containing protein n=1 Tax=Lysinibacillus sp. NPDC096212 TaxID=3364135 RepID=UPI00382F574E